MNLSQFRKRILIESGIFAAVIIGLGSVTYLLSTISDDYTENNNNIHKKVDTIDLELDSLQRKYAFINKNADLYKEVQKRQAEGKLFIKRQMAFEKFNQFRSQFNLNNLRLSVSPIQEMSNAKFKRKTNTISVSDVNMDTDVLYDESIYQLLDAMQRELSGICLVTHLSIAMDHPLNADVLKTIGTKGTYPLFKTSIKFNWYSINPVEISDPGTDAPKK